MELSAGNLVEIIALPSLIDRVGVAEQEVYRACLGFKLVVVRIEDDGLCVVQLHQEWSHFPGMTPFDLRFEAACLRAIVPFSDAEWAALSAWIERDATIAGEVFEVAGRLKVRLDGGVVGDLALPDDAPLADFAGATVSVRIIQLNRRRRDLVLYPAP